MRFSALAFLAVSFAGAVAVFACGDDSTGSSSGFDAGIGVNTGNDSGTHDAATTSGGDAGDTPDAGDGSTPLFAYDGGTGCTATGDQTTLAPAAAGIPATGLVLWLRGDRGIYATTDSKVCAWLDLSGQENVLANPGASLPALVAAGVGGKPAVQFSDAAHGLFTTNVLGIGGASGRTFVAVVKLAADNGRFEPIVQGKGASIGTYVAIDENPFNTAGHIEGVITPNNSYDGTTATSDSAPHLHVFSVSTMAQGTGVLGAISYRVNGVAQTLTRKGGAGNGTMEDFTMADFTTVGAVPPGTTGVPGNGIVAEVLVYDHALSTDDVSAVESALKSRYTIP